jgi:hypothetical protein
MYNTFVSVWKQVVILPLFHALLCYGRNRKNYIFEPKGEKTPSLLFVHDELKHYNFYP